ncbi:MAG: hypothetical protein LBG64_00575 [Pseudomonadales bacterium]|jgi:hypothetical protein|nr:hypothetical protein [Pseudomonadales bacterium]
MTKQLEASKTEVVYTDFKSLGEAYKKNPKRGTHFKTNIPLKPIIFNGRGAVKKLDVSIGGITIMNELEEELFWKPILDKIYERAAKEKKEFDGSCKS